VAFHSKINDLTTYRHTEKLATQGCSYTESQSNIQSQVALYIHKSAGRSHLSLLVWAKERFDIQQHVPLDGDQFAGEWN